MQKLLIFKLVFLSVLQENPIKEVHQKLEDVEKWPKITELSDDQLKEESKSVNRTELLTQM